MSVLINRTRLITFRLSVDEYESLRATCLNERARSISEFARSAVLQRVEAQNGKKMPLGDDLSTLTLHLGELDGAVRELCECISRALGSVNKNNEQR